jgi:hypothetical protein
VQTHRVLKDEYRPAHHPHHRHFNKGVLQRLLDLGFKTFDPLMALNVQ